MGTEPAVRRLLAATVVVGVVSACPKAPAPEVQNRPVATVNGQGLSALELRRELWRLHGKPEAGDPSRMALAQAVLEQMVEEALLLQAAETAQVSVGARELESAWEAAQAGYRSRDFKASLYAQMLTPERMKQKLRERLTIERYLRDQLKELPRITDAQVKAYYDANRGKYRTPAQVRARQVVVRTPDEAHLLHKRLVGGESFERLAREHSVAPERERGGDLGFFAKGVMPEVFDKVCFSLEPGQISDVIGSEYGQHIFQVTERRPEQDLPLDVVSEQIRESLRKEQAEAAEVKLLAGLREKAAVVTYPEVLSWAADLPTDGGP